MDSAEKMAADIALAMNGGEWKDGKWYSKGHREAWIKAVQPYADEIERLREAIKVQANAVRSLHYSETTEINRLRKTEREAHIAIETLDSERKANALLTDEIERLREALGSVKDCLEDKNYIDAEMIIDHALQQKYSE